jgi:tRNA pseudouridine55 synthase
MPADQRDTLLLPVDALLAELPVAEVGAGETARMLHGQPVRWSGIPGAQLRVYGPEGFIGLAEQTADGWLQPKRLVATAVATD